MRYLQLGEHYGDTYVVDNEENKVAIMRGKDYFYDPTEKALGPQPPPPDPKLGIGGAPTRNTTLPTDAAERKKYPMATGLLDYFPDALAEVSHISWHGNEQHNPGQPLHWARGKSRDEDDTTIRHFVQRGTRDVDGLRHTAKAAWRILATLQKEIEDERNTSGTGSLGRTSGVSLR